MKIGTIGRRLIGVAFALGITSVAAKPGAAYAGVVTVDDTVDATATSTTGNATSFNLLQADPSTLAVVNAPGTNIERSIAEFSLATLPANSTITGATLTFHQTVTTTNVGRVVDIYGFTTAGTPSAVTLADATASAVLLGSYDSVALGNGDHTVTLSAAALQAMSHSGTLFLRLQGDTDGVNTGLVGASGVGGAPPQLAFTVASAPEPSTIGLALVGSLGGLGYYWRRRRLAQR